MGFEPIVPGVFGMGVPKGYVNAFLILSEDGAALVDTGLPKRSMRIEAALRGVGVPPDGLKHLLITHHHVDHTGSLAALAAETGANVYVHPLDAPIVRGQASGPPANRVGVGRVLGPVVDRFAPAVTGTRIDHSLTDGETLDIAGGLEVVFTPGHTAGHCSFLLPSRRVLFVGDAAGALMGRIGLPVGMYTEDMAQAKESVRKLAAMDFDTACFGHGSVVKGDALARFRKLVDKLAA
jgi:glyoxylase-like metal-dependent hydrolase (beta-lactamase superfamily II)